MQKKRERERVDVCMECQKQSAAAAAAAFGLYFSSVCYDIYFVVIECVGLHFGLVTRWPLGTASAIVGK